MSNTITTTTNQKQYKRSEQTRKFAEARREFQRKCRQGKVDKQKLTMFDLIFYNPTTNLMSNNNNKKKETTNATENEENVDDPSAVETDNKPETVTESDDENSIPAPQIKIGANGEIIVDEQSLIIENKETKRNREALQATQIIDGDLNAENGFYKRMKRSKEWTKSETLRFYKALNTLGTDFSVMCELFPGRDRTDLKKKFKREEKINKVLIDKAIMEPVRFDIDELRTQVEIAKKELAEQELSKIKKDNLKKEMKKTRTRRKYNIKGNQIFFSRTLPHFTSYFIVLQEFIRTKTSNNNRKT